MPSTAATQAARVDEVFKALASAPRRELLRLVASHTDRGDDCCAHEEMCACRLADALDLAPSTISHHMNVLVNAGLVSARKEGLWVYYRVERAALADAARELETL